ncbi:MAG: proline dehydrogenase family protein [Candidatus Micrarchaeota archaeon]
MTVLLQKSFNTVDLGSKTLSDRFLGFAARRYLGGMNVPSTVAKVKQLNTGGTHVILDLLGENGNVSGTKQERADRVRFVGDLIRAEYLNASVAMRLGQFDGDIRLMLWVAGCISKTGTMVWFDSEKKDTIDDLICAYKLAVSENVGEIGIALQAYLHRTMADVQELVNFSKYNQLPVIIRPVRGVYVSEADIREIPKMHENLARMMQFIETCGVESVHQYPASHHPEQIARAILLHYKHGTHVRGAQLLYGVYDGKILRVMRDQFGIPTILYVPFGPHTTAYLTRRLEETGGAVKGLLLAGLRERRNADTVVRLVINYDLDLANPLLPFVPRANPLLMIACDTPI